jgi:hypothetical protein
MFLDWPFQVDLAAIRQRASDATVPASERALDQAIVEHVHVEAVGRYRDALARIGGAQLVSITRASELVGAINAAINAEIRRNDLGDRFPIADAEMPGTWKRFVAAAEKDHPWLAIDGHALRVSMPVHEQEWAAQKAKGLFSLLVELREAFATLDRDEIAKLHDSFALVSHALAGLSFAYGESDGMVTFRLGDPARPATIRAQELNKYDDSLEFDVARLVKQDVDAPLARRLAGEQNEPGSAGIRALAEWGPPEERVRAMARAAESDEPALARKSNWWLKDFSADWNHRHNLPKMPSPNADDDPAIFARACLDWCRAVREFPNPRPDAGVQPVAE